MKAVKYHGVKNMELIDIPKPQINENEVLVKIMYCGICGTDIHAYSMEGMFDWELVPGHEAVGIVEEVGKNVDCVKPGDRVAVGPPGDCGNCYSCNTGHPNTCVNAFFNTLGIGPDTQGAYAEYIVSKFPKNELFLIPDGVSMEQAVLFDLVGVGFHAVRRSDMRLGDCVVVSGCGSVGLAVIQSAKLAGASTLIAFDPLASKRELALKSGADYVFDPNDPSSIEKAKGLLKQANGAQVCFEAAGNPYSIDTCISLCMPSGQIMLIGNDGRPYQLVTAALGPHQYDLKFTFTYTKEEITMLFDMIKTGKFDLSAYTTLKAPLEDAVSMLDKLAAGEIDAARVLLMPNLDLIK
ncbi:alcohol dehydrogenase catalytic domain-containing protein [Clostridium sp. SYSU_GA19001]|uniref:zinc-dependent alcohol dehydrogenase n=1 Tax=Clostridium caldaquaticum TaxID=2940653 RepID=UPI0020776C53|nr:alcohol dehydrogenase catalytic domain-containing protein [Clostridium caldaquaticum]MCM8711257.1 alcohol dehydrogenase catalytic domain-containing protein [Clostridium caldaquaticum]